MHLFKFHYPSYLSLEVNSTPKHTASINYLPIGAFIIALMHTSHCFISIYLFTSFRLALILGKSLSGALFSSIALYVFVLPWFRCRINKAYCYWCVIFSFGVLFYPVLGFLLRLGSSWFSALSGVLHAYRFLWPPDFHTSIGVWVRSM